MAFPRPFHLVILAMRELLYKTIFVSRQSNGRLHGR
jgi:hypothetical protein